MPEYNKKLEIEKLLSEIERLKKELKKKKKYGLVWEDKPEDIIEGDNYHALSVLNYTHKGKIDVIYIDLPYNTGAQDWKYNREHARLTV